MKTLLAILLSVHALCIVPAAAQFAGGGGGVSQAQLDAVQAIIPTPLGSPAPANTLNGSTGVASTYIPGDATAPTNIQGGNAVTDGSGNWSITWSRSFVSTLPLVHARAIVPSTNNPISCEVSARSATAASGWCRQSAPALLNLSIITSGLTLNPFAAIPVTGTAVMVTGREPTQ